MVIVHSQKAPEQSIQDALSGFMYRFEKSKSFKFMMKNAFIDEFLNHAEQDGIYDFIF